MTAKKNSIEEKTEELNATVKEIGELQSELAGMGPKRDRLKMLTAKLQEQQRDLSQLVHSKVAGVIGGNRGLLDEPKAVEAPKEPPAVSA